MFGGVYGDARMPNWPHWHHTPLPGIATMSLRRDKGENALGQATFLPPFLLCYSSVRMVRLHSPFILGSQDLRISGLGDELAAGCLWSRPTWIIFCFRCWVADGKKGVGDGNGEVRHWVLGGGGYGPPLPLLHYLHLVAHCQSDKSSHLVPSFCAFQHNRDQTFSQYCRKTYQTHLVYRSEKSRKMVTWSAPVKTCLFCLALVVDFFFSLGPHRRFFVIVSVSSFDLPEI